MIMQELAILRDIFHIQRRTGIHIRYYLPPILLSLIAATFEGLGMSLLIPLTNGFFTKDFSFMKSTPVLGTALNLLPASFTTSDRALFGVLLGMFVAVILLKNAFKLLASTSMAFVTLRSMHHLRKTLINRYLNFGKLYFDRSNLGHDTTIFAHFAKYALRPLLVSDKYVNAFFSLCGSFVVMSLISWKLTLFALPLFVVMHLGVRGVVRMMHSLSTRIAGATSLLAKQTAEILSNAPFVQAFNTQDSERRRFGRLSDESARLGFRMAVLQDLAPVLQEIVTLAGVLLLVVGMLFLLTHGGAGSPQSFIVYFYLVLNGAAKFGTVSNIRGVIAEAKGNVDEVSAILSDKEKYPVPEGAAEFRGLANAIELRNLHFRYPDGAEVLRGLSLSARKGTMTAIVGPTGAGKTTIVNLLLRHYDCPAGAILLDDRDIRGFTHASLRRHIAFVSQDSFLFHETIRFNVTYGTGVTSDDAVWSALERARLAGFVKALPSGLDTLVGDRGVKLSGGEKQRLSIARALLKGAEILLLDEATSSLDSKTEALIQEAIDDVSRGKTSIVIAHRLSTIKHADNIVVIEDGKCAEQGRLDELLNKKGRFHEYWEQQKFR